MSSLRIDIAFDFVCPWCLIGKRQLDRALTMLAENHVQVQVNLNWKGVQLLPHLPAEGLPFNDFYRQRLGSEEAVRQRQAEVQSAAAAAGQALDLSRIDHMPNTANAHRLFQQARQQATKDQLEVLLERLFAAYFYRGEDLGNSNTLLQIAHDCGLDTIPLLACLDPSQRPFESVLTTDGVPSFTIGRRLQLAGAQPAQELYQAICLQLEHAQT